MASRKHKKILSTIEHKRRPISPWEIAKLTEINYNTVRAYCRKLLESGHIKQRFRGYYESIPIYGMGEPLKIHNLILVSEAPWLEFSRDISEVYGSVKVRVQFGIKRHKITCRISNDGGMDYNTICLAISRFYDLVKVQCGRSLDEVIVKTFEANRDYEGIRLDGSVMCLTREGLFNVIERIYQKAPDIVRIEEKVPIEMSVQRFEALVKGGITQYNLMNGLMMLINEIREIKEAWKFSNREINEIRKILSNNPS